MEDLKKLLAAATPGPWEVSERIKDWRPQVVSTEHGPICTMHIPEIGDADPNAALIVAAVNALPELVALRKENERLREALKPFSDKAHYWLERDDIHGLDDDDECATEIRFGDFRRARAALNQEPGQ